MMQQRTLKIADVYASALPSLEAETKCGALLILDVTAEVRTRKHGSGSKQLEVRLADNDLLFVICQIGVPRSTHSLP